MVKLGLFCKEKEKRLLFPLLILHVNWEFSINLYVFSYEKLIMIYAPKIL